MSRWFRHYAGLVRDEKLVRAAIRSKQTVERVVWVWGAILESAAEVNDGGRYELDQGEVAYFLRCDETDVVGVVNALEALGRLHAGSVVQWAERQFESDTSRERQKRYRERKKRAMEGEGDVTAPSPDGEVTLQETETETEKKDSLSETSSDAPPKPRKKQADYPALFEAAWRDYPTDANMSKKEAFDAWKRLDEADVAALAASIPAFKAYCRASPDYRPIHLCRFIRYRRFDGFAPGQTATQLDDERWRKRLDYSRTNNRWPTGEWGPRPGEKGCQVPGHLLRESDGKGWTEWERAA